MHQVIINKRQGYKYVLSLPQISFNQTIRYSIFFRPSATQFALQYQISKSDDSIRYAICITLSGHYILKLFHSIRYNNMYHHIRPSETQLVSDRRLYHCMRYEFVSDHQIHNYYHCIRYKIISLYEAIRYANCILSNQTDAVLAKYRTHRRLADALRVMLQSHILCFNLTLILTLCHVVCLLRPTVS